MHVTRKCPFRPTFPSVALAALAALWLAAPRPACAQALLLYQGDSLSVSGSGTDGVLQGKPVHNGANSYSTDADDGTAIQTLNGSVLTLHSGGTLSAGGLGGEALQAYGGTVAVTGGLISAGDFGTALVVGNSATTITGGILTAGQYGTGLNASGSGTVVRLAGGTISVGSGGTGLIAQYSGTIDLFGSGFVDGSGRVYSPGDAITSGFGTLTGTLLSGQTLRTTYSINGDGAGHGTIEFNVGPAPAPEPSAFVALGLGASGLGGLALKARKRRVDAA